MAYVPAASLSMSWLNWIAVFCLLSFSSSFTSQASNARFIKFNVSNYSTPKSLRKEAACLFRSFLSDANVLQLHACGMKQYVFSLIS